MWTKPPIPAEAEEVAAVAAVVINVEEVMVVAAAAMDAAEVVVSLHITEIFSSLQL